jgi:tRNA (guanine-N7-)-methyltransferase
MQPSLVWCRGEEAQLQSYREALPPDGSLAGTGAWEVELGFGKGRYLLRRAAEDPERRFLGVEIAAQYYRLARDRAGRRGIDNLVLIRGEAVYLLATHLGAGWADHVHVYFPDPWPKDRHHKRRLFDPETVDLVLGLLKPDGRLYFASDHLDYAGLVRELLAAHPAVELEVVAEGWPEGPRTNYEAKFVEEGRPIVRLVAGLRPGATEELLHPAGRAGVLAASRR